MRYRFFGGLVEKWLYKPFHPNVPSFQAAQCISRQNVHSISIYQTKLMGAWNNYDFPLSFLSSPFRLYIELTIESFRIEIACSGFRRSTTAKTFRDVPLKKTWSLVGSKLTHWTNPSDSMDSIIFPVSVLHTLQVWSYAPDNNSEESFDHHKSETLSECFLRQCNSLGEPCISHTRTLLSKLPDAMYLPQGENLTE